MFLDRNRVGAISKKLNSGLLKLRI